MFRVSAASSLALAAILVSACSQKSATPAASATAAAPANTQAAAAAAPTGKDELGPEIPAKDVPALRAGYWEVTNTETGRKPTVNKVCESGKHRSIRMGKDCNHASFHRTLFGNVVMDAECAYGPMHMAMHMEAKGDFNSHYTVDSVVKMKMAADRPEETHATHGEGRYLGPCPAGETPEDAEEGGAD